MGCLNDPDVQALADGEGADEKRWHVARCGGCARRVERRRLDMAQLSATAGADLDVPSALGARVRQAISGRPVAGATSLRASGPTGPLSLARVGAALAMAAAVGVVVFGLLPRLGAPTSLSAAQVLDRSLATLSNARGIERLEYELVLSGIADGSYRIEHLIDHDDPARYHLRRIGPDGQVHSAVAQDPATGRLSRLIRIDDRNYVVTLDAARPLPSLPQMAQAQIESVIAMMQATADQKLSVEHTADGMQYVVETPPIVPAGGAALLDVYRARAVIDGTDFHIRAFDASGTVLKQPYTVSFRFISRDMATRVAPEAFAIEAGAGDVVLEGTASDEPWTDVLGAALREVARLRAAR